MLDTGEYGSKYDTPNEFILASIAKWHNIPNAIPKNPAKYPKKIYINLNIRT